MMRIHIQNPAAEDPFAVTRAQWTEAANRAGYDDVIATFGETAEAFAAGIAAAEILVAMPGVIARLLPLPPTALRTIFCLAAGVDRLAPFDWLPPGVAIWNNRGAHGTKAGEYALMALLMLATGVPRFVAQQRDAVWRPSYTPPLRGRRLVIVGTGDLGASAARHARHVGMHVTGVRRSVEAHPDFDRIAPVALIEAVLPTADFVLLACPLTPLTRHLMSRARLSMLPKGAGVVNIGRGALLDQAALCDLLAAGHLGGAMLDVTDPEPPPADDRIWSAPNLILTPHISADDPVNYNAVSLDILFANLAAEAAGRAPPNHVDLDRGY